MKCKIGKKKCYIKTLFLYKVKIMFFIVFNFVPNDKDCSSYYSGLLLFEWNLTNFLIDNLIKNNKIDNIVEIKG